MFLFAIIVSHSLHPNKKTHVGYTYKVVCLEIVGCNVHAPLQGLLLDIKPPQQQYTAVVREGLDIIHKRLPPLDKHKMTID